MPPSTPKNSRTSNESLALIEQIARTLVPTADVSASAHPVLALLCDEAGYASAAVAVAAAETGKLRVEDSAGTEPVEARHGVFDEVRSVASRAWRAGEPISARLVEVPAPAAGRRRSDTAPRQQRLVIAVPLRSGRDVRGVLIAERIVTANAPEEDDVRLLEVVAALLNPVILLSDAARDPSGVAVGAKPRSGERASGPIGQIIGGSKAMQAVFDSAHRVASSSTTVLLLGESGTGKELVARGIHAASARASGPLVAVNCGALPESLIESELFGHEKGAFTGAHATRRGRFEQADGGTIFLDEVGELTAMAQVRLLRVLQEREFERVGGNQAVRVDVRVIAATSRDLERMVEDGSFRLDLYYRLAIFPIVLPPLRDRPGDVVLLADHFVAKYNRRHLRQVRRIATSALDMLNRYHWPGNVRELENVIERAVLLSTDDVIHGYHLPPSLQTAEATGTGIHGLLDAQVEEFEKNLILDALKSASGNMAAAARALGVTERVMGLRVRRFGIEPRRFRNAG